MRCDAMHPPFFFSRRTALDTYLLGLMNATTYALLVDDGRSVVVYRFSTFFSGSHVFSWTLPHTSRYHSRTTKSCRIFFSFFFSLVIPPCLAFCGVLWHLYASTDRPCNVNHEGTIYDDFFGPSVFRVRVKLQLHRSRSSHALPTRSRSHIWFVCSCCRLW